MTIIRRKGPKRMTKRAAGAVSNKEFLRAWCEAGRQGEGLSGVAQRVGLSYSQVYDRHTRICLLLGGLRLPELRGQRRQLWEAREVEAVLAEEARKDAG